MLSKPSKVIAIPLLVSMLFLIAATSVTASWTSSGQSITNWRSQPLESTISVKNVGKLAPVFSVATGGDVSATPNISGGVAYFPDWGGNLWAVNATTGATIWEVNLSSLSGIPGLVSRTTPTSATMGTLLVGTLKGGWMLAINQRDGSLLWKSQLDSWSVSVADGTSSSAVLTSSPSVFQGVGYVGIASDEEGAAADPTYPCCSFRGSVEAFNISTGQIIWRTYTVPANEGYSGNAVWGSEPVVDPARNSIYVGTGNNYTAPDCVSAGTCAADPNDFTDSVLALDMSTGAVKWADRTLGLGSDAWNVACFFGGNNCPNDAGPDYDFGQGPMKLKATIGGESVDILGIGQKSGMFWGIDASTGKILWSTNGGPGSTLGGMEWGSATDGTRIYYAVTNQNGTAYTIKNGTTIHSGLWGALDPATGAVLWQTADPNGGMDPGAVSVANGVVYAGSSGFPIGGSKSAAATNPSFFALNAATGQILWSFASGGSSWSGPAIANGMVYWGTGYARFGLGYPNHKFYAFGLP